jgi:hypothetical protein
MEIVGKVECAYGPRISLAGSAKLQGDGYHAKPSVWVQPATVRRKNDAAAGNYSQIIRFGVALRPMCAHWQPFGPTWIFGIPGWVEMYVVDLGTAIGLNPIPTCHARTKQARAFSCYAS